MHQSIFGELSLIIAIGTGIALFMRLIRQPLIIGHILTGLLVGPSVLHLVKSADTIEIFSNIGIALLLFIIGLGLNPRVIKEVGKVAGIAGFIQVGLSVALGYGAGIVLGLGHTESLFLGVALSFSSTIIILKLLSDKKEQTRLYGKIVVGLLLVQDVLATLALLFITANTESGFSAHQLFILAVKGWTLGAILLLIGNIILPKLHRLIAGSQEFLFLFAIGWGFGSAALFERAGFSLEIGALIAGVALSGLPYTQEISSRLRPLRDFFIIVFFISLGTRLTFDNLGLMIPIVILSSFLVIVIKPMIVMLIMGIMGYTKRTSFKAAIAMGQVSEFSLVFVILGNRVGMVSDNLVGIVTMVALISIAATTYMIIYADKIYLSIEEHLEMFEHTKPHPEREMRRPHYDYVLFGYLRGGHEFLGLFKSLGKHYVVVDYDPEVIDTLEHQKANYIYGDATDIELLEEVGLEYSKLIVSAVSDHDTNLFLAKLAEGINPNAVVICYAENAQQASELYELGASYVMVPHYIGSEKISSFIRRSGLKKSEFKKYREKHLAYLQSHFNSNINEET